MFMFEFAILYIIFNMATLNINKMGIFNKKKQTRRCHYNLFNRTVLSLLFHDCHMFEKVLFVSFNNENKLKVPFKVTLQFPIR